MILTPRRIGDERGWFSETYAEASAAAAGITERFVQDNHSFSAFAGTIRGLHFQRPPHVQAKLVRCLAGSIMDYVVDIRRRSPTFGRYIEAEISADNGRSIFVPAGFAHAFITLQPNTEIAYKVSDVYAPDCDAGLAWNDPDIGIAWPLPATGPVLSEKDRGLPLLRDLNSPFEYDGVPLDLP